MPFEIHIKVFDGYLDICVTAPEPMRNFLFCLNHDIFISGKIKKEEAMSLPIFDAKFDFVKFNIGVFILYMLRSLDLPENLGVKIFDIKPTVPRSPNGVLHLEEVMSWSFAIIGRFRPNTR